MLRLTDSIRIPEQEVTITQIRASGPGGQNVNKVASAVHLRFDIAASSLPETCKKRLLTLRDSRVGSDGTIVIKARQYRSFEKNKEDALGRLARLIAGALERPKERRSTRPTRASRRRRLESKSRTAQLKSLRRKVGSNHD